MLRKVFFSFCLFYSFNDSYAASHCNHQDTSGEGNPSFEVRGIFQPCVRELSGKDKVGVNEEGEQGNDLAMKCSKKIFINLKITNQEPVKCHDQLILIDHVYDPLLNGSSRLLNPVVIRVKQEQIIKLYDLTFLQLVNAEPKEVTRKLQSHSKKCKKPVSCGKTLKQKRKPNSIFQGICCSCDPKKMRQHSRCNKDSHMSCLHHQSGSLPYKDCVSKAHDLCINEDSYHNLQEFPNLSPTRHIPGENMNDLCHGKRVCHAMPRMVNGDDEISPEWRNKIYAGDENDNDHDGSRVVLNESNNGSFMGEKYFHVGETVEHDKMAVDDDDGSAVENQINNDEPSSVPIDSIASQEGSSIHGLRENMDGTQVKQAVEDVDVYPSHNLQLDEDEMVSGEDEDEMVSGEDEDEMFSGEDEDEIMNGELKEILKRGASSAARFTLMDSRRKKIADYPDESVVDDSKFYNLRKRGLNSGRDNCLHKYADVALHCLKFSKLWYEVYRLSSTTYKHVLFFQIFEKKNNRDGNKVWVETTQGKPVRLSSCGAMSENDDLYRYQVLEIRDEEILLNPKIHRLLVPHLVEGLSKKKYPEATGKPAKFLILSEDFISANGSECDKAGVGLKAFVKKKGRCTARRGLCLKNQPSALWRMDKKKTKHGHKGQFFLENFGQLSKNAYMVDEISGNKTLSQDFNGTHVSQADIVVPVINNHVVRKGMPAQITAIVADATKPNHTILTVSVANLGLASARFTVQLGKCNHNVIKEGKSTEPPHSSSNGASGHSDSSRMVIISPLHQTDFTIDLSNKPSQQKISCTVEVLNDKRHILAVRRVVIKNGGRCICLWHCKCDCMKTMVKIKCRLMTLSEVNAAGLKGTVPALLPLKPYGYLVIFQGDDSPRCLLFFLFGILLILLLLGLAKAILGVTFWHSIWIWGLPYYCGPRQLVQYREVELVHREVNLDEEGYPVHPDTKKRTVQLYNRWIELLLNIFIFLIFPILALFWWPVCWCCSLCHRNIIGYRWIFSAKKKSSSSHDGSSENSATGSLPTSDPEDVAKSSGERSTSKYSSKTGSDGGSKKSSLFSRRSEKDQMEKENENTPGIGNTDAKTVENNNPGRINLRSKANSQIIEDGNNSLQEPGSLQVAPRNPSSMGRLPSFESHLSIETYDGTADEQEVNDVDYVLKQLRRSSTAIQKSQERISPGGLRTNRVMPISMRGEVVEDPDVSPRLESSSEDSAPGGSMMMKMAREEKEKDFMTSDSAVDNLNSVPPLSNQVEPQILEMHSRSSSQGRSSHLSTSPATMDYPYRSPLMGPSMRGASEKTDSAQEEQTISSFSEVTTKDSLEVDKEGGRNMAEDQEAEGNTPDDVAKALVEKLHAKRVVFRNIDHPIGEVEFPINQPYCIRGYFLQTNGGYKFIPPTPLWQYWTLDADGINMVPLVPPRNLFAGEFEKDYANTRSVTEAGDISEFPLSTCINVQYQNFDSPLSTSSHSRHYQ